jgi:hypothetical protein
MRGRSSRRPKTGLGGRSAGVLEGGTGPPPARSPSRSRLRPERGAAGAIAPSDREPRGRRRRVRLRPSPFPFLHAFRSTSRPERLAIAIRRSEATRVPAGAGETVVLLRGTCIESRPPAMDAMPGTPPDRAPCSTLHGRTGRASGRVPVARQAAGTRGGWDSAVGWCRTELLPTRMPRGKPGERARSNPHREL